MTKCLRMNQDHNHKISPSHSLSLIYFQHLITGLQIFFTSQDLSFQKQRVSKPSTRKIDYERHDVMALK